MIRFQVNQPNLHENEPYCINVRWLSMAISSKTQPLTREERREKRATRRAKQREQNAGRAAKMHQARLLMKREGEPTKAASSPPDINIGCSGWFYWHWKGKFYPVDMKTSEWFAYYRKRFRTVELNAPFYSWPTAAAVAGWIRQAGKADFVYTVKVSELITHTKKFKNTKTLVQDFGHIADLLGSRMGCFLFQLPPSFTYTTARLRNILAQLDPERRNVVEFRHASWWRQDVYDAFEDAGAIFCSCSGPRLPDDLIKTADDVYVRFHGVTKWYRYDYSKAELSAWAQKIRDCGARRVWIYFNNDFDGYALKNAKTLSRMLKH